MTDKDLKKHAREFKGYLDKHQYDVTDEGILFPKAGALASGEYFYDSNGANPESTANLLPTQGLNYLLETSLPGVFAVGDVRAGNVKRVASAVGEGSIAISFVHRVLAE